MGYVRTAAGKGVGNFAQVRNSTQTLVAQHSLWLSPGSFVLSVKVTDRSTGQTYSEKVEFEVN